MRYRPKKIISGGQTGADLGGLLGAEGAGIPTGGTAPLGYRTETGSQPKMLAERFGLLANSSNRYEDRTRDNVKNADATLIFTTQPERDGTQLTITCCETEGKPCLVISPFADKVEQSVIDFLEGEKPSILNIAGNRESISPGITVRVATLVERLFAASSRE